MTPDRPAAAVVNVVVRDADRVLLVRQQGKSDAAPFWALPGGRVEPGEAPLAALARELHEETGLLLSGARPIFSVVIADEGEEYWCDIYEATAWTGVVAVDDPEGKIDDARFLAIPEAIRALEQAPYSAMRDPELSWLREECEIGQVFRYPSTSR